MRILDASAIGLSGLCLLHCLALPMVAVLSPVIGAVATSDLVHSAFVALAVPASAAALRHPVTCSRGGLPWVLAAAATAAIVLLLLGVIGWPAPELEIPLTIAGASVLAGVHVLNWRYRSPITGCRAEGSATAEHGPVRR